MMIYIDDELLVEIYQTRAANVRAFDHEYGVIRTVNGRRDAHLFSARQLLIGMRHLVSHDNFHVFIKRTQQPVKTKGRTQTVTIGAEMGGDRKLSFLFDQLNNLTKHNKQG